MITTPLVSPEAAPAQALKVQLVTRITTQRLHYRSGEEESAAESVHKLFDFVRDLLNKHPDAWLFQEVALAMINGVIRPYTARWHGWMTGERRAFGTQDKPKLRFRDEQVRRMFRRELQQLQLKLQPYLLMLERLVQSGVVPLAKDTAGTIDKVLGAELAAALRNAQGAGALTANLGVPLPAGIQQQVEINTNGKEGGQLAKPDEINAGEQQTILTRRIALGTLHFGDSPRTHKDLEDTAKDSGGATGVVPKLAVNDAIGLALSGGGIRSATFCLGIVQVLVRRGLLPQFDYLSTVSGGGYLGSFLSTALGTRQPGDTTSTTRRQAEEKLADVFRRPQEGVESGLLRHIRNSSKYLLNGGFLGQMRILGVLASGLAWNVMIILPIPLFAALLAYQVGPWFWGDAIASNGPALPSISGSASGQILKWLAIAFGSVWVTLPGIELIAHGKPPKSGCALTRRVWEMQTLYLGLGVVAAGAIYLIPALFHGHEWLRAKVASAINLEQLAGFIPASLTGAASAVLAVIARWLSPQWPRLRSLAVKLFILTGPLLFLFVFLLVGNRLGLARDGVESWSAATVCCAAFGLALWSWLCVNINTLAPHRFYRNRLCECYLARRIGEEEGRKESAIRKLSGEKAQGRTEVLQQVKLSDLSADLTAPYHLVNMTLNVPTSENKNLRGRGSDFFFASRHFFGSPLTGYAKTAELERTDPHFDLGTAMAVSGAAASTSMGWKSLPHFRFLMTLFNVRLGYWLHNPSNPSRPQLLSGAGPWCLFREMAGRMDETCRYVNLSDGGHIENLAAYELLRRRCKFIVCVDGGCEPGMECSDLIRLQRYAEIDLGVRMHFDISDLQIGSNSLSRAHAILVKIDYAPETAPDTELGWLLYVKLAVTGVEPVYVKDYQRENPDFPHQTTGDQFFDEEQFEAYRSLGECAMEGLFRSEICGPTAPTGIHSWFQSLADHLLPDNDSVMRPTARSMTELE